MQTRARLIEQIAKLLMVKQVGQSLSAEDYQEIDESLNPALEDLSMRRVLSLPDYDEFEDGLFLSIALFCAAVMASTWSGEIAGYTDKGMSTEQVQQLAIAKLRTAQYPQNTDEPITFVAY